MLARVVPTKWSKIDGRDSTHGEPDREDLLLRGSDT